MNPSTSLNIVQCVMAINSWYISSAGLRYSFAHDTVMNWPDVAAEVAKVLRHLSQWQITQPKSFWRRPHPLVQINRLC